MGQEQRYFAGRVGAFYGALFLVYGVSVPYLSVYLDWRGMSATEIGLLSSVPLFLRLFLTPGFALHADRTGDYRGVIIVLLCLASAALALSSQASAFWPLLVTVTAFQVSLQSTMPLIETIAMAGVKRGGHDYGRMRLCGSVTFVLATFVAASAVGRFGATAVVWLLIGAVLLSLASAVALPKAEKAAAPRGRGLDIVAAAALSASTPMVLFMLACGTVQSAHAVYYAFGVLHWRATGIPSQWIGVLWSAGVVVEIMLFWGSTVVLRRLSPTDLIAVGAGCAVLRWTLMAFDPPIALLLPLQLLHGLTYGATHLGAMHFIRHHTPQDQAGTAQALYSTVTASIGMGLALFLAGQAYARYAGLSYLVMALLSAVGLGASLLLRRTVAGAGGAGA